MIRDSLLMFTGVGTSGDIPRTNGQDNVSTYSVDLSPLGLPTGSGGAGTYGYNAGSAVNAGRDIGVGTEMWLSVLTTVAATSAGAATMDIKLVTDSTAGISTKNVLLDSGAIAVATLVAGYEWKVQLPSSLVYYQYIALDWYINSYNLTAGTFEGKLIMNIYSPDLYVSGFNVQ